MTAGRRVALLVGVVVIAVVAFVALKPDSGSKKQSSVPTTGPTAQTTPSGGSTTPSEPPIQNVRVKGGKPVGGVADLGFQKGDEVRFAVTSDVADEVHVHGYDLMKDVTPGKTVVFAFKGDIDGEFEVELENRGEQIASLKVSP